LARGLDNQGGFTKAAHDLGQSAQSPEEVASLRTAQKAMEAKYAEARANKNFDEMSALASQGQFFREAAEAAEGTGSAVVFLRKQNPDYKPPFPTQAQPNAAKEEQPKTYVIRHGSTKMNNADATKDRIRGHIDIPLSAKGRKEAEATAKQLENSGIEKFTLVTWSGRWKQPRNSNRLPERQLFLTLRLRPWKFGPTIEGKVNADVLPKIQELINNPDTVARGELLMNSRTVFLVPFIEYKMLTRMNIPPSSHITGAQSYSIAGAKPGRITILSTLQISQRIEKLPQEVFDVIDKSGAEIPQVQAQPARNEEVAK